MKRLLKRLLPLLLTSDLIWNLVRGRTIPGIVTARRKVVTRRLIRRFEAPHVVLSGPFKGLVYPTRTSAGSALVPKLLGTYESELHAAIADMAGVDFSAIVDIGCAEGYYAVGLARLWPRARVLAYDVSERARRLCTEMARANHIPRVEIRGLCDRGQLLQLARGRANLILSDCEGYERELFNLEVVQQLRSSYFIVELHDHIDPLISRTLRALFQPTHSVTLVGTVDERTKADQYDFPLLRGYDRFEREVAFAENRGTAMQWLIAFPRTAPAPDRRHPSRLSSSHA